MRGAANPPIRPNILPQPTPIERTSVGNNSAAKIYTAQNEADIRNFPAKLSHLEDSYRVELSEPNSIMSMDPMQQSPPVIIVPDKNFFRPIGSSARIQRPYDNISTAPLMVLFTYRSPGSWAALNVRP